jgi:hypothetical protein
VSPRSARTRGRRESPSQQQSERPRLQLEFTPEAYKRLYELKRIIGARTNAEVIRKALHVLDWVVTNTREDYKLQLVKGDTRREVELVL